MHKPSIDSKVCNKKVAVDDRWHEEELRRVVRGDDTEAAQPSAQNVPWSCVDYVDVTRADGYEPTDPSRAQVPAEDGLRARFGNMDGSDSKGEDVHGTCVGYPTTGRGDRTCAERSMGFVTPELGTQRAKKHKRWEGKQTNRGWPGTAEGKINTAQGMAGDLVSNLDSEEKDTVAQILTRNVSGGEVVEIPAVTTASVMTNVCYDLEHRVVVPFACVGFGANFVSITDGHVDAKLAYKVKAGLSYNVTPRVTAFVSGFYHQVLGDGEYNDVPLQHLNDDQSPEGRSKNYALAKFKMAYSGAEVGVRFGF